MVATKVLISLCALGLARAAPQLGVPLAFAPTTASVGTNQNAIVTNVVTALQPQIADAVARALASLSATTSTTSSFSSNSNLGGSSSFNSGSSSFNSGSSSSGFNSASSATGAAVQEEVTARPNYNYEFKVADDDEQTYITHNEARDGDDVTGTYSYIDPNGALITVNYQAGAMGYTQTLDKQDGAVQIRSKAGSSSSSGSSAATGAAFGSSSSSSSSSNRNSASSTSSNFGSASRFTSAANTASSLDQSALITQIIAALQPQIASAVNTAVGSQQQTTVTRTITASNNGVVGDRFTPLFGN